ncbi:hypothetical protein [Lactococcus lactis]|uniref:hypothetical protein n=1 Tax=Lactococcus lactis TaxID=1358 RepID=UPI002026B914|nr:hypothetical protein [Lactococcus lactis]MCL9639894.1 hypothetical protein [Lactococcus lactis]
MTETAKERIYHEAKKRIDMRKNGIHPSDYFEGWVVDYIDSSTTDKLSVEKLQEQLNTAKKALTEISVIPTKFDDGGAGEIAGEIAHDALAAIGNEGSGDE